MIVKRKADERGHAHHGWLESWHSFHLPIIMILRMSISGRYA